VIFSNSIHEFKLIYNEGHKPVCIAALPKEFEGYHIDQVKLTVKIRCIIRHGGDFIRPTPRGSQQFVLIISRI